MAEIASVAGPCPPMHDRGLRLRWLGLIVAVGLLFLSFKAFPWWWGRSAKVLETPFPAQLSDLRAPAHP